jgi:hypothetical protein
MPGRSPPDTGWLGSNPLRSLRVRWLCVLIVHHSFEGRFSDSPRALYEALVAVGAGHEHVWLADPAHRGEFPPGVASA